ncbi:MAG: hypothetical protein A2X86_13940 [Bdellovibrionales bacterium GWA2_49_15]|nr:MAG: hypothetical protein A2X86_13940 [Bdellovibrionales bacterium GWA2_49_15]HAZ13630.1 hypothetical protein [Bdellovibrionales bacterium]
MISALIFWTSFTVIVYHYAVFVLIIYVLSAVKKNTPLKGNDLPFVSIIVAAYNEEKVIARKILNSFALDYPKDKMEIIVVSDGSTDDTPAIVKSFKPQEVICVHDPIRRGKSMALNRAVNRSTGKILFFTDANTILEKSCMRKLVRNFSDGGVGGVSGKKDINKDLKNRSASLGDKTYWQFESALKLRQSQINSISTADGEVFAIRRCLYEDLPDGTINDDSTITIDIVRKGYRVVYEPEAISSEEASITLEDDFNVKARMVYGGLQVIQRYMNILNISHCYFIFQFLSHKALRYTMPIFLLLLLGSNVFLTGELYSAFLVAQMLFYLSAAVGFYQYKTGDRQTIFYYPLYYTMVNLAALKGIMFFLNNISPNEVWKKALR